SATRSGRIRAARSKSTPSTARSRVRCAWLAGRWTRYWRACRWRWIAMSDANESFEREAALFAEHTAYTAPGKDVAAAAGGDERARHLVWVGWTAARRLARTTEAARTEAPTPAPDAVTLPEGVAY